MECEIIRSERRSFSLQVRNGGVIVRAPLRASDKQIREFVRSHEDWILRHIAMEQAQNEAAAEAPLTEADLKVLKLQAQTVIPERAAYYAEKLGVTYGKISIRHQRSRWGSCSAAGDLNFNCLLMLAPPAVLDSVVVHELCHRKEMNHSSRFYDHVLSVFPDYHACTAWLKTNGPVLTRRMPGKDKT